MRSTDEQLREIMRRAETVKAKRILRKRIQASAIASCACVALLIAVCFYLPRLSVIQAAPGLQQYGSLLLAAPYMGYVVVGVLAFALGICVTLLCVHWKALKQKERERK
jgi:hypothetical protein